MAQVKYYTRSLVLLLCCIWITYSSAAIISVDLGSEWYKVMLMQGRNFDIILNDQSGRKTPSAVGFNPEGERVFSSAAVQMMTKNPDRVFSSVHQLLGKNFSDPVIEKSKEHFPYKLVEQNGRYGIYLDDENIFSPEEVVAMILQETQKMVASTSRAGGKDLVLVVPPYVTQHERTALINSAQISGYNTLAIVNEGLAAAVTYAFTKNLGDDTNTYIMFYDVGSSHTSATLVNFTSQLDTKKNKTSLNVRTVSTTWDQFLGGRDFDYRLASYFLKKAEEKTKKSLEGNKRVFYRLLKEAKRAKEILSANSEAMVFIENLTSEDDFSITVTRTEFETMCEDLLKRVLTPIHKAVELAGLKLEQVDHIQVLGGTSRLLRINDLLVELFGAERVGRNLNGDEASINGATLFGATQSSSFAVRNPIYIKDAIPFNVGVRFHDSPSLNPEERYFSLFSAGREYGAKKTLTINNVTQNVVLDLVYEDSDFLPLGTDKLIARYEITGIPLNDTFENFVSNPSVSINFVIKEQTGIIEIARAKAKVLTLQKSIQTPLPVIETPIETPTTAEEEPSTANQPPADETENEVPPMDSNEKEPVLEDETQNLEENTNVPLSDEIPEIPPLEDIIVDQGTETFVEKTRSFQLNVVPKVIGVDLDSEAILASKRTLSLLDQKDTERREREQIRNELESFVYSTRDLLYEDAVQAVSTEQERETYASMLSEAGDWIYGDGIDATTAAYKEKLELLKKTGAPIVFRLTEISARPEAVAQWNDWKDSALLSLSNITEVRNVEEEEKTELVASIEGTATWLADSELEQAKKKPYEDPVWTTSELKTKVSTLDSQLKKLLRRAKRKPVETPLPDLDKDAEQNAQPDQIPVQEEQIPTEPVQQPQEEPEQIIFETATEEDSKKNFKNDEL